MRIDVYLHIEPDPEVLRRLDVISQKLGLVIYNEELIMSAQDDALTAAEAAARQNSDAEDAAEKLLLKLVQMINDLKANNADPAIVARITALSTALQSRAAQLSEAVVANTPAA